MREYVSFDVYIYNFSDFNNKRKKNCVYKIHTQSLCMRGTHTQTSNPCSMFCYRENDVLLLASICLYNVTVIKRIIGKWWRGKCTSKTQQANQYLNTGTIKENEQKKTAAGNNNNNSNSPSENK